MFVGLRAKALLTKSFHEDPWRSAGWAGAAIIGFLIVRFATDAGITYDEQLQVDYGELILDWYRSGFTNQAALHYRNLYLYGGLFDAPAQLLARLSPLGVYETRHLLVACIAAVGIVATWKGGALIGFPLEYYLQDRSPLQARFEVTNVGKPDVYLHIDRYMCQKKRPKGQTIHTVEREGVALLYVLDVRRAKARNHLDALGLSPTPFRTAADHIL